MRIRCSAGEECRRANRREYALKQVSSQGAAGKMITESCSHKMMLAKNIHQPGVGGAGVGTGGDTVEKPGRYGDDGGRCGGGDGETSENPGSKPPCSS